jgi:GTP cyclohydrolase II
MILISRSKKKIIGLEGFGLKIKKQIIIKWRKFLLLTLIITMIYLKI